jgi:hypothetical protein
MNEKAKKKTERGRKETAKLRNRWKEENERAEN